MVSWLLNGVNCNVFAGIINTIISFSLKSNMTPEQFTYWLQGYTEINGNAPTVEQWEIIKDHLKTVFHKVTPQRDLIGHDPYIPTPSVTLLETSTLSNLSK